MEGTASLTTGSNLRTIPEVEFGTGNESRRLSLWSSFMNFLHCPPGPLGRQCQQNNSGGGGGSDDGASGGGGGYYTDNGGGYYTDDGGGGGNVNGSAANSSGSGSGSWWGWGHNNNDSGSSGSEYTQQGDASNSESSSFGSSWAIFGILAAVVAVALIASVAMRNKTAAKAHPLTGSVHRRKDLFESVFCQRARGLRPRNGSGGDPTSVVDEAPTGNYNRI